jgi:hypothetical protein
MGQIQLLQLGKTLDATQEEKIERIYKAGQRINDIIKKMGTARRYVARSYVEGLSIVDFDAANRDEDEA